MVVVIKVTIVTGMIVIAMVHCYGEDNSDVENDEDFGDGKD